MSLPGRAPFCCAGFEGMFDAAGKRGIGVFALEDHAGRPSFRIQFRSLDPGNVPNFSTPFPLSLMTQTGLTFCPWCGVNLSLHYSRTWRTLLRPELGM
ncbi:MAG: hypothetical protein IT452_19890 [Planctomycetia bacterium]|nr:hypothetical protein [Planctomycetia bacterium]